MTRQREINFFYALVISIFVILLSNSIVVSLLILCIHLIPNEERKRKQISSVRMIIVTFDFIFVLRYLAISTNDRTALGQVEIDMMQINRSMTLICICLLFLLLGIRFFQTFSSEKSELEGFIFWLESKDSTLFLNILLVLVSLSIAIVVFTTGGINQGRDLFFSHQKLTNNLAPVTQLGLTFKAFFFLPLLVLLILKSFYTRRILYVLLSFILMGFNLFYFGGRLSLFLVLIITLGFLKLLEIRVPFLTYAFIGIISVVTSVSVVASRTGAAFASFGPKLLQALSYPVLDAFTIVSNSNSSLRPLAYSSERVIAYLTSFIPRFLWPDKPTLTAHTLDATISNHFGYARNYGKTGWPSGFLIDASLFQSIWIYPIFIIIFALYVAAFERFLLRILSSSPDFFFVNFFIFSNVLVTFMKDGDILTSGQLLIRLVIWLNIFVVLVRVISNIRKRMRESI